MFRMKYFLSISLVFLLYNSSDSHAVSKKNLKAHTPIKSSLVVDAHSGKILHSENATSRIHPASLTKLMTLYMSFDAIKRGVIKLDQILIASSNAENMKPCKLGLVKGESISVKNAIMALIVKSANDAAVVIAESIASNEEKFARMMNVKAKQIGMHHTNFMNSSGWHHPDQKTTALDLAKLTLAIKKDFPEYYKLFNSTSFIYKGQTIKGHNKVTENYAGAEGMKTGYTKPSGFNLVTTASREGKSLVAIVTGGKTALERDNKIISLLDKHFNSKNSYAIKNSNNNKGDVFNSVNDSRKNSLASLSSNNKYTSKSFAKGNKDSTKNKRVFKKIRKPMSKKLKIV